MGKTKRIDAIEVYGAVKRAINDFSQAVWELKDRRPLEELDDPQDQDAFDALDDVCLITAELCGLWDRLWGALGDGRPDTIPWVRRDFEGMDPEAHDHRLERQQKQLRAARELRRAIEEDVLGVADPLDGELLDMSESAS